MSSYRDDFARTLRSALQGYGPEAPAEEMWREIRDRRRRDVAEREGEKRGAGPVRSAETSARRRPAGPRWRRWGLGTAALLALAFGLSRTVDLGNDAPSPTSRPTAAASGAPSERSTTADASRIPGPFALTTAEHLREAETLLVLFRSGSDDTEALPDRWARSLLGRTRLLMDSPATDDRRIAEALDDLELVLVQIANLGGTTSDEDRRFVEEILRDGRVLSRLRTAAESTDPFSTAED